MADKIVYIPNRVIDMNGIADGAALYVYQSGGTTPVDLFSDPDCTAPVTNPYVVSTGAIVPPLYTNYVGDVRFRVVSFDGSPIMDEDPYEGPLSASAFETSNGASLIGIEGDGNNVQAALDASPAQYDPDVPVATHQDIARKDRYIPNNILLPGAWIKGNGVLRSRDIDLSPYNSGADNLAAWNVWRDRMQTLQQRQESRPVTLIFDEDLFEFSGASYIDVQQSYIQIEGRGAVIDGTGVRVTNAGSVNPNVHCRLRDLTVRNAPIDGFAAVSAYYFVGEHLTAENITANGFSHSGGNNIFYRNITGVNCGLWGFLAQRSNNPHATLGYVETALIALVVDGMDFRKTDAASYSTVGGGIGLYECESARILGNGAGTVQNMNTGSIYARGVSVERCRDTTIDGVHLEDNLVDIYVDTTHRVASGWSNHAIRIRDNDCSSVNSLSISNSDAIIGLDIEGNRFAGNINHSGHVDTTGILTADNVVQGGVFFNAPGIIDMRSLFDADGLKLGSGQGVYVGGTKVVGARQPGLGGLSGGSTADAEARAYILAMKDALVAHGLISP